MTGVEKPPLGREHPGRCVVTLDSPNLSMSVEENSVLKGQCCERGHHREVRADSGSLTGSAWQRGFPRHPEKGSCGFEVDQGYPLGWVWKKNKE